MRGNDSIQVFLSWTWLLVPTKSTLFASTPIDSSVPHAAASVASHCKEFFDKFLTPNYVT
jgi:hypothetical protein